MKYEVEVVQRRYFLVEAESESKADEIALEWSIKLEPAERCRGRGEGRHFG